LKTPEKLNLPEFPTTTIGSFPQTKEVRRLRAQSLALLPLGAERLPQLRGRVRVAGVGGRGGRRLGPRRVGEAQSRRQAEERPRERGRRDPDARRHP